MRCYTGRPFPLGVTIDNRMINFAVDAGREAECSLLLYRRNSKEVLDEIRMKKVPMAEGIHCIAIAESDARNLEYNYKIDGIVTMDPFVPGISGKRGWLSDEKIEEHELRGRICNSAFDWEDDRLPNIPDSEVVAYSLHMRGYTRNRTSDVKKKGTFTGLIEKIPYLKLLGINQIQCLPIYEFEEWLKPDSGYMPFSNKEDWKINYWGYGPGKYMAPKSSYAAGRDAARELKTLVHALHQNNMELIMNFPFDAGVLPQDMIHVLRCWHMEYHIDGFLINPYLLPLDMVVNDPVLRYCKIYINDEEFQNMARKFLKGDEGIIHDAKRLLSRTAGNHRCNTITSPSGFTLNDLVSYENKHNEDNGEHNRDGSDYNLSWNCGVEGPTKKKEVLALRKNQARNAMAMLLLAQGTPCILAGDEFLNSQKGNNNVYCQDNTVGWTDWNLAKKNEEMIQYVSDLIAFRKKHPALRSVRALSGNDPKRSGLPDVSFHGESAWQLSLDSTNRQFGMLLGGTYMEDDDIYIVYNMHWNEHDFALPTLKKGKKWYREFTTSVGFLEEPECLEREKKTEVKERTIEIFVGR